MNAIVTNAISNALHAIFLFTYFSLALYHYLKNDRKFTLYIVLFFFVLFCLKCLGVYVHYFDPRQDLTPGWVAISLFVILLNYLAIHSLDIPNWPRVIVLFVSILASLLFITVRPDFLYIAASQFVVYLTAILYSRSMTRAAFSMIVLSNLCWIGLRLIENAIAGHEIPPEIRYDNDIYHVLLIISSFLLYESIRKGCWSYPKDQSLSNW